MSGQEHSLTISEFGTWAFHFWSDAWFEIKGPLAEAIILCCMQILSEIAMFASGNDSGIDLPNCLITVNYELANICEASWRLWYKRYAVTRCVNYLWKKIIVSNFTSVDVILESISLYHSK